MVSLPCKPIYLFIYLFMLMKALSRPQAAREAKLLKMFTKLSSGKYNLNNFEIFCFDLGIF